MMENNNEKRWRSNYHARKFKKERKVKNGLKGDEPYLK